MSEKLDPRTVTKANSVDVKITHCIGPLVSGNGCEWWMVRMVKQSGKLVAQELAPDSHDEFVICDAPATAEWGWDITKDTPTVFYAFAYAVEMLLKKEATQ